MLSLVSLRASLRRQAELRRERALRNPVIFAVTSLVMLLGFFMRARGYLFQRHGFWLDEAAWALLLIKKPLVTLLIRPIGFMSLSKLLAQMLGPSEVVLRFISWVAGIATLLLAPALSRRLYRAPMARLLFVAVIALHPGAIDLAKEFKPYSASLCGHVVVLLLVLRYLETQVSKDLLFALLGAFVANLFSQDLVFAYPGMFLVLGWDTLIRHPRRLAWVFGGALVIVGALLAQYWFIWRHLESDAPSYWGHKYNVFYVESTEQSHLAWWFGRYADLAAFPGLRHKYWDATWLSLQKLKQIGHVDSEIWWAIHAVGLAVLVVRKRFRDAVLLLMPFATITLLNTLGQWPFGAFRANLFLLTYSAAIAGMAFDWHLAATYRWFNVAPVVVLLFVPLCLFDRNWNERKRALSFDGDLALVLNKLVELEPEAPRGRHAKTILFLSGGTCSPYQYYSTEHPSTSRRLGRKLKRNFEVRCGHNKDILEEKLAEGVPAEGHAWLISDLKDDDLAALRQRLADKVAFRSRLDLPPHELEELTRAP